MSSVFVDSGASGANNGTSKANAYVNMPTSLIAGNDYITSHTHNESVSSGSVVYSGGATGNPPRIISTNFANDVPTKGAVIANTTTMTWRNDLFVSGVRIKLANSINSVSMVFGDTGGLQVFEDCDIEIANGTIASIIATGTTASTNYTPEFHFIRTNFKFSATGQNWTVYRGRHFIYGGSVDAGGTIPNTFVPVITPTSHIMMEWWDFDFSAIGSGKNIFAVPSGAAVGATIRCYHCKRDNAATTMDTIGASGAADLLWVYGDGADTNYVYEHYRYEGTETRDVSTYVTSGGSADGTPTKYSHKLSGASCLLFTPLRGGWIPVWNSGVSAAKTIELEILYDGAADLTNKDIGIELSTMQAATRSLGTFEQKRCSIAPGASTTAWGAGVGIGSWTKGAPITGWRSQKLSITSGANVTKAGPIYARPVLYSNKDVFVSMKEKVT